MEDKLQKINNFFKKTNEIVDPYIYKHKDIETKKDKKNLIVGIKRFNIILKACEPLQPSLNQEFIVNVKWLLGRLYHLTKDYEKSHEMFINALHAYINDCTDREDKKIVCIANEIACQSMMLQKYSQAVYYFNMASEFDPEDYLIKVNISTANLFNRDLEKAAIMANKILEKMPNEKIAKKILKTIEGIKQGKTEYPDELVKSGHSFFGIA